MYEWICSFFVDKNVYILVILYQAWYGYEVLDWLHPLLFYTMSVLNHHTNLNTVDVGYQNLTTLQLVFVQMVKIRHVNRKYSNLVPW